MTEAKKKKMNYIVLYSDEWDYDSWCEYCDAAGVSHDASEITIWFKIEDVESKAYSDEPNDDRNREA